MARVLWVPVCAGTAGLVLQFECPDNPRLMCHGCSGEALSSCR